MSNLGELSNAPLSGTLLRGSQVAPTDESSINLRLYIAIVLKHKWSILLITLVAAVLSFMYATSLEPRYRASVTMLYDPPSSSNYGTVGNSNASGSYNSYFNSKRMFKTQELIVGSKSFSEKMVDHYQLWEHPQVVGNAVSVKAPAAWKTAITDLMPQFFSGESKKVISPSKQDADLKSQNRSRAVGMIQGGMVVSIDEDIMLLTIGFNSSSAEFAKEMANKLAEFYSQYELEQRMESYNQANTWLVDRTKELRDQLMISEQALQNFKSTEDVGLIGGQDSIASQRLENIFTDLSDARKRVQSLSQTLSRLQRKNNNFSQIVDSDALLKFTAVREAMQAESEASKTREQLALVYGPRHPNIINAESNLNRLQQKLNSEIQLVVVELRADLNAARSDQQRYNSELESLKSRTQSLQNKTFRLTALERARDTDQQLYDLFVTRFKELNVGNSGNSSSIRVLNFAQTPGAPYWPNKGLIVAVASLLTLAFGIGLAFLQELLDNTIKTPDEVEEKLGLPLLGQVVHLDELVEGSSIRAETFFIDRNNSPFAESIRTIRTGIMLSGLDDPYKIITVTSTVPGEGKTTQSINIACALGQLEKVLIIDADMRKPSVGAIFGIARNTKGLADVVAGLHDLNSCLLRYKKGNIDILPAGTLPPNPQELLSSDRFRELLEQASKKYDRVIIDTAPSHLVSDPKLVARWASAIIYVVKADSTPIKIIAEEIKELKKVNKPFIGVILNDISKKRMRGLYQYGRYRKKGGYGYGDRYGYGYGYGYGHSDDEDKGKESVAGGKKES
ncbi:MAG: capsular exopolysaccharide synthesis family protein [Arenicella sp.]|jgi:capsular exopolysaccharide synthesis family protein